MTPAFMESALTDRVLAYAQTLARLSETQLTSHMPGQPAEDEPWSGYLDDARSVTLFLNLMLNRLVSEFHEIGRSSQAVEICTLHHRAYRDLTGALTGVDDLDFDRLPADGEWPLRTVIWHITGAELGFSLLIDWAVARQSAGNDRPISMPDAEMEPNYDEFPETGTMQELMDRYASLHQRVIVSLSGLTSEQLQAPNIWWEGYEIPAWFRMHRFDAHLREHTIQIDKTLAAIDRTPSEAERLARLLHQSLADVEILLSDADDDRLERAATNLASKFDTRREHLQAL